MGDHRRFYSAEEAFEDLWRVDESFPTPASENQINPYKEFSFSPFEEQSGIDDHEFNTPIHFQPQDGNFPAPNDMFAEQGIDLFTSCAVEPLNPRPIVPDNSKPGKISAGLGFRSNAKERKFKREARTELEEESLAKKQDHNAKERMRRLKLHASYIALGSLLPVSRTSKKKWTAPVIIGKVVDYIPELESEIQQLNRKKNRILSVVDENKRLSKIMDKKAESKANQALTVSVTEVKQGELILQICEKRESSDIGGFSKLLRSIEGERMRVLSASTLHVCDERECYTIHVKMNESSSSAHGCDYIVPIKEKLVSWLS